MHPEPSPRQSQVRSTVVLLPRQERAERRGKTGEATEFKVVFIFVQTATSTVESQIESRCYTALLLTVLRLSSHRVIGKLILRLAASF